MGRTLIVDREATARLQKNVSHCECDACQNYYMQLEQLPHAARKLFEDLGVDLNNCLELWSYDFAVREGYCNYSGYFPVIGEVVDSEESTGLLDDWKIYSFGEYTFQLRFETLRNGGLCIGLEATFPIRI